MLSAGRLARRRATAGAAAAVATAVLAAPLGASTPAQAATATDEAPSLDLALFGVAPDSFLVSAADARAALGGPPGLVLDGEREEDGVEVGDR